MSSLSSPAITLVRRYSPWLREKTADSLHRLYSEPPRHLLELIRLCNVKDVVFKPLLVSGAITPLPSGGFRICVDSGDQRPDAYRESLLDEKDGGASLPPRMRFTVAHELCHTFFFNSTGQCIFDAASNDQVAALESLCNRGAGALLLPEDKLASILKKSGTSASQLVAAARNYGISPQVLVLRIGEMTVLPQNFMAAVARIEEKALRIEQYSPPPTDDSFCSRLARQRSLPLNGGQFERLKHSSSLILRTDVAEEASPVAYRSYTLQCRLVSRQPLRALVAIHKSDTTQLGFGFHR